VDDFSNPDHVLIKPRRSWKRQEVIFCLDFSVWNRVNELGRADQSADAFVVNIDHHQDPGGFWRFQNLEYQSSGLPVRLSMK